MIDLPTVSNRWPLKRCSKRGDWRAVRYSWRWLALSASGLAAGSIATRTRARLRTAMLVAGSALGLLGVAYATLVEPARLVVERFALSFAGLPAGLDGLRIMQLSDIHLGTTYSRPNLERALAAVRQERPDLVVLTGDFVSYPEQIADLELLLRGLAAPLGCYAVLGNHDHWEGPQEVVDGLRAVGIDVLLNEHRQVCMNGASLWLAGVDEPWSGLPDLAAALHGIPADGFCVLLAHAPEIADQAAVSGVSLQLSGHTHGGLVKAPLLGPLALPRYGLRYTGGLYQLGSMILYTNRGIGGTPFRLNCSPEVTVITLRKG